MSAARVEADWLRRQGPDKCPPEYRPWLEAVASAWAVPVEKIWWRSIVVVTIPPQQGNPEAAM